MAKAAKAAGGETGIRLSRHPRASRQIAAAKGWGGLGAFLVVLVLSLKAGLPASDAILRGMFGGLIGFLAAWLLAVSAWRHIALAELETLRLNLIASMEAQAQDAAAAIKAAGGPEATVVTPGDR